MRTSTAALAALAVSLLAACATTPAAPPAPPPTDHMAVAGPTLGVHQVRPSACQAGERLAFLGADLVDEESEIVVRLAIDPIAGPRVRVFKGSDPYGPAIILAARNCKRFHFDFAPTGSWVNGINEVKVGLDLDCVTVTGDSVAGHVAADACL